MRKRNKRTVYCHPGKYEIKFAHQVQGMAKGTGLSRLYTVPYRTLKKWPNVWQTVHRTVLRSILDKLIINLFSVGALQQFTADATYLRAFQKLPSKCGHEHRRRGGRAIRVHSMCRQFAGPAVPQSRPARDPLGHRPSQMGSVPMRSLSRAGRHQTESGRALFTCPSWTARSSMLLDFTTSVVYQNHLDYPMFLVYPYKATGMHFLKISNLHQKEQANFRFLANFLHFQQKYVVIAQCKC